MHRAQISLADLRLDCACNYGFHRGALEQKQQAFDIEAKFTREYVRMVIDPELSPHILQDGITSVIYYGAILTEQQVDAVEYVLVNIVHKRCGTIIGVNSLFHFFALCARKRYALAIMDFYDFANGTDTPTSRQLVGNIIRKILSIECLCLLQ